MTDPKRERAKWAEVKWEEPNGRNQVKPSAEAKWIDRAKVTGQIGQSQVGSNRKESKGVGGVAKIILSNRIDQ